MDRTNWNLIIILVTTFILPTRVDTTWWYLSQLPVHSLSSLVGNGAICENIPGLIGKQRRLCRENPDVMLSVVKGAKMGVRECQSQFKNNRWNCSTSDRDASVFGKVMLKVGSREASFVYSVSSAGVVHAITRACSKGDMMNCACDPSKHGYHKDKRGEFKWGGCSDNVQFGSEFTRKFVDARERKIRDARAEMNIHNNRAGRKAVKKNTKLECKCHGVSGSCAIRTCWQAMQDFKRVGVLLRDKYNGAIEVEVGQEEGSLIVANINHKEPTRSDLVYFENSPDYCVEDSATGSLGTAGRECKKGSMGTEGCDIMCCGRGYDTKTVQRTRKCECKFIWCCHVKCQECLEVVDVHTCKENNPMINTIGSPQDPPPNPQEPPPK